MYCCMLYHNVGPPEPDRRHRQQEDRYYPHYYSDPRDVYAHNRANIDPYATLTPSERLRGQKLDPGEFREVIEVLNISICGV